MHIFNLNTTCSCISDYWFNDTKYSSIRNSISSLSMMNLKLKTRTQPIEAETISEKPTTSSSSSSAAAAAKTQVVDLGNGSEVVYIQRFITYDQSWDYFEYLNKHIPWTRPTIRVFGRSVLQPRDSCYIASEGLPELVYSGFRPRAYSWDEFPPLKEMLETVHKALPGSRFNSLVLNRYKGGNDYVAFHADDEKIYGPTPEIASVTFGCEREFILKKREHKIPQAKRSDADEPPRKRAKKGKDINQHSFMLKHGSMLVMKGYTQRDWLHSVPKRVKAESTRINLTFRCIL